MNVSNFACRHGKVTDPPGSVTPNTGLPVGEQPLFTSISLLTSGRSLHLMWMFSPLYNGVIVSHLYPWGVVLMR